MLNQPKLIEAHMVDFEAIDQSRWYTNFGPKYQEYQSLMSERFLCHAVPVSSCTTGLTLALMNLNLPKGSICAVPSWTFVATICAIQAAGLTPHFIDIDDFHGWAVTPQSVIESPAFPHFACVVPVAPFGGQLEGWAQFQKDTGVKVVIDAAGGFDGFRKIEVPTVISTHATKVFSTAEGGLVLSPDAGFAEDIKIRSNFGITPTRQVYQVGLNGKISEYHCAIGLAEYQGWLEKRKKWLSVIERYKALEHETIIDWASSLYCIKLNKSIDDCQIPFDYRRVWTPCHKLPAYKHLTGDNLQYTEDLYDRLLFLPLSVDMTETYSDLIIEKVRAL